MPASPPPDSELLLLLPPPPPSSSSSPHAGDAEARREHCGDEPDGSLLHGTPPPGIGWLIDAGRSSVASASPTASASAPSTCARSPSTPAHHARGVGRGGQRREAHGAADAVEQQVAGRGEVAADDQALRVEHVEHERRRAADHPAGVGDHAPAAEVAVAGERRASRRRSARRGCGAASPAARRSRPRSRGSRGCRSGRPRPPGRRARGRARRPCRPSRGRAGRRGSARRRCPTTP